MRLERLVIDAGERSLATEFHPRLTVIGGLSESGRTALVGEVLDSLAGARPGVHLELVERGHSITVFRPAKGRHRVVDTDSVADVTDQHLGPDGDIDLFAAAGVDRALARRTIRFSRDDLVLRGESDAWIARLAGVDQNDLWETAMRCRAAEQLLERVSESAGTSSSDAAIVERVEEKHAELVEATETYDRTRLIALTLGTIGAIGAVAGSQLDGTLPTLPFLALAVVGVVLATYFRLGVNRAARAERSILAEAGADDYSSFHFERVSALLDSDNERRRFMLAVSDHRKAAEAWADIAGPVPLTFAMEHERQIRATAELHTGVGSLRALSQEGPEIGDDLTAELAQCVLARLEAVRALTGGDDSLPMIVDDPFDGLEPSLKPMLLEMLAAQAGNPQLIVLTSDADVLSWAEVEQMTGDVAVVEPTIRRVTTAAAA